MYCRNTELKKMHNNSGKAAFTLVELVITVIIVGILSVVAVPIYRGYVSKAMMSEAKALMGAVEKGELIYASVNQRFIDVPAGTGADPNLDIDVRSNKYFTSFEVSTSDEGRKATAITRGAGEASHVSLTLRFDNISDRPVWIENI